MQISDIRLASPHAPYRVEADVDGYPLWFECDSTPLAPSPEAFLSALWVASLTRGEVVTCPQAVDATWLRNLETLTGIFRAWWGVPDLRPEVPVVESQDTASPQHTALCFTGGVDSFHALLQGEHAVDDLVFVHGYDIPLDDAPRLQAFKVSLEAIGEALGKNPVILRTNLREHPSMAGTNWGQAHGGALAAVGHLLSSAVGRLVIPSSYTYDNFHPWGSSWKTDRLWSSNRVELVHADASLWRLGKLREIAHHPLVRTHLRVCWENRSRSGNCSGCDKCVRTMLSLHILGELERSEAFDHSIPLHERVDALPAFAPVTLQVADRLIANIAEPRLRQSVKRLVGRTRRTVIKTKLRDRLRRMLMR